MHVKPLTFKDWMLRLGYRKSDAASAAREYARWQAQHKAEQPARFLKVEPWQNWEKEYQAFLDRMPRKPHNFISMVAEADRRRAQKEAIQARKAEARKRYLRRYARRASPAQKISRQAEHGTGEILGTGLREQCEAMPTLADRMCEVECSNAGTSTALDAVAPAGAANPPSYKTADARVSDNGDERR